MKLLAAAGMAGVQAEAVPTHYLTLVEAAIERALDAELRDTEAEAPQSAPLVRELGRTVASGGKRLRPAFGWWGYRAAEGPTACEREEALAQAGAAIELLHTAALIHDDVVDGSLLRRGEPTAFRRLASEAGASAASERFGRSAAILAGDLAHALADRLLAEADFPPALIVAAFEHFNRMRVSAARGEYLDLLAASAGEISEEQVRRLGAMKSGSYTVVGPLLIGAALAEAGTEVRDALVAYGEPLGEAFQLRDDVLGTFGDPALTGKDPDDDLREGKQTMLVAVTRRLAGATGRRALDEALGRPDLPPDRAALARAAMLDSGALSETLELIEGLADRARFALVGSPVEPSARRALDALAGLVVVREA